jgi:anthranilate synthase component 1
MTKKYNISKESFLAAAKLGNVVPVFSTLFGGNETPVGIYEKLSAGRSGTFLLESAEQGVWSRYSFIGVSSRASFIETDQEFIVSNQNLALPTAEQLPLKPLEAIRVVQASWNTIEMPDLPPLTSGLVGLFSWDVIRDIENLPDAPAQDYARPKIHLEMVQDIIVLDHKTSSVLVVSNIYCDSTTDYAQAYDQALDRIEALNEVCDDCEGNARGNCVLPMQKAVSIVRLVLLFERLRLSHHVNDVGRDRNVQHLHQAIVQRIERRKQVQVPRHKHEQIQLLRLDADTNRILLRFEPQQ